jgi:hypothetical protein
MFEEEKTYVLAGLFFSMHKEKELSNTRQCAFLLVPQSNQQIKVLVWKTPSLSKNGKKMS